MPGPDSPDPDDDLRPLPTSWDEYLEVWCGDLLAPLTDTERRHLMFGLNIGHGGGPWPSRLRIQRLTEQARGLVSVETVVAEISGGQSRRVDAAIAELDDPDKHEAAMNTLCMFSGTPEFVRQIDAALERDLLSQVERTMVLDSALHRAELPAPIPLPEHLRPLPADYPESYDEWRRRDPPYRAVELTQRQRELSDQLGERVERGEISPREFMRLIRTVGDDVEDDPTPQGEHS